MNPFKIVLLASTLFPFAAFSQNHGDCVTALPICNKDTLQFNGAIGTGNVQEAVSTCLSMEFSSTWISWGISEPGKLTFTLTPSLNLDDLDFAVYKFGAPNDCDLKTLVRCMAAGENVGDPTGSLPCMGPTGLNLTETDVTEHRVAAMETTISWRRSTAWRESNT